MKYSFYLKNPKAEKETLIYFFCYFKNENKKFVYSTGENINPINFDFTNKFPITSGINKSKFAESIKMQLNRYSDLLLQTESLYKKMDEVFTSIVLKKVFNEEFKKTVTGKNTFFDAYDEFTAQKKDTLQWSKGTVIRYQNIKNMLQNFEKAKKYNLTFRNIDTVFFNKFSSYCLDDLKHINNTYLRNIRQFKTFMLWSLKEKKTYNNAFENFNKDKGKVIIKPTITKQIALTIEDLNKLMKHDFKSKRLERSRDIFIFACVTGFRYGEMASISRTNVTDDYIILKEEKDESKEAREIPLTTLSRYILLKYEYNLPLVANQKQNAYIKEVFAELEYTHKVQKVTTKGKENIKEEMIFKDRISTHTARRTFITMMKRQGKSDKLIASITGHTDMKTLNAYYQVNDDEKKEAMDEVFEIEIPLMKISEN